MSSHQQPAKTPSTLHQQLDLDFALKAAGLGVWEYDPQTDSVNWDEQCGSLYGLTQTNQVPYKQILLAIHPDDIARVDAAVQQAVDPSSGGHYDQTYRTIGVDDGQLRWVRFQGKVYFNEASEVLRFAGVAQEVTPQLLAQQAKEESQRELLALFEQSSVGLATISSDEKLIFQWANTFYSELVARPPQALVGKPLLEALPELKDQGFDLLLKEVVATGQPFVAHEVAVTIRRHDELVTIYVDVNYQPRRNIDGLVNGILVVATDVTKQVLARKRWEESETKLRGVIAAAPAGIGLFIGRNLIIEGPNQTFIDIVGKGPAIEGLPLREVMPELVTEGQSFLKILDDVYTTGVPFISPASLVKIVQNGVLKDNYYNISYTPLRDAAGEVYAILDIAIDVTQQVNAQQALAQKSQELELAMAVAQLGSFRVDLVTQKATYSSRVMEWFGLTQQHQPIADIFSRIDVQQQSKVIERIEQSAAGANEGYHDLTYRIVSPFDKQSRHLHSMGQVIWQDDIAVAVSGIIQDVTQQLAAQQQMQEAIMSLRNAVELAELGNFSMDVASNLLTVSPHVAGWFGFESLTADTETFINGIGPSERDHVRTSLYNTLLPGADGRYDVIHSVINAQTGRKLILHALGQLYVDSNGQPVRIDGIAQDITSQHELQVLLEQQVQERTEELAATNEELSATNEELAANNEELEESNSLLFRSNENLQQFAYVASHDLQEPLRKIQSFGDLLTNQYSPQLGEGVAYLERMQAAASRMSSLIKDLLSFSRIATQRDTSGPIALTRVVQTVLTDLDLVIAETGAVVDVGDLPTVDGDRSQLEQLFQNLLSNALKFRRQLVVPHIQIRSRWIAADSLPAGIRPARKAIAYYQIDVADNGVGFEEKYLDRIFQVFQRLYGKNEYAGTGIGLAICEKVVTNHGGTITATSQPGKGSTFTIYLPL